MISKNLFPKVILPILAVMAGVFYFAPTKSSAATSPTLSGKCAAMASTSSFLLNTINTAEYEVSWIGIIDFDAKTVNYVKSEEQSRKSGGSQEFAIAKSSIPIYLHDGSTSGAHSGMWSMTFNNDPNATDKIILVPSNSGNTILMLDIKMGSTGVCQKL